MDKVQRAVTTTMRKRKNFTAHWRRIAKMSPSTSVEKYPGLGPLANLSGVNGSR
jgi:hypothetical protein